MLEMIKSTNFVDEYTAATAIATQNALFPKVSTSVNAQADIAIMHKKKTDKIHIAYILDVSAYVV